MTDTHGAGMTAKIKTAKELLSICLEERRIHNSGSADPMAVRGYAERKLSLLAAFSPGFMSGKNTGEPALASELKSLFEQILVVDQENARSARGSLGSGSTDSDRVSRPIPKPISTCGSAFRQNLPFLPGGAALQDSSRQQPAPVSKPVTPRVEQRQPASVVVAVQTATRAPATSAPAAQPAQRAAVAPLSAVSPVPRPSMLRQYTPFRRMA